MQYAIVGTGPAGVIAAETLRKTDPEGTITLIGEEPEPPYSRMAIPYYLIGKIGEQGTYLRKTPDHFERLGIELRQTRATGLDAERHELSLAEGGPLGYDRLLIATGSRPAAPPIPGIEHPRVHPCWTLTDAREIAQLATPGSHVVLLGAGFIGCIVLEALALRGVRLSVVEMGDRMVPRMMNQKAGAMIKQWCIAKGVDVHTSTRALAIDAQGDGPVSVRLDNGQELPADLVISATGVRPNIEWLQGSGIATEQGILVNAQLQASVADVYAAGDVAQGRDFCTGGYSVQAIQPTASEHGRIAALNMAGSEVVHQGSINMNVLDTLGLISSSFGLWMGVEGGDSIELHDPERFRYLNLQFDGDHLVGATSIGLTEHVGVLRGLIQTRAALGAWKERLLRDPTRLMEAYLATAQGVD